MSDRVYKAVKSSEWLPEGVHRVRIVNAVEVQTKESGDCPKVFFEDIRGREHNELFFMTAYRTWDAVDNKKSTQDFLSQEEKDSGLFQADADGYAVICAKKGKNGRLVPADKPFKRAVSVERTQVIQDIFGKLGYAAGIDGQFRLSDLLPKVNEQGVTIYKELRIVLKADGEFRKAVKYMRLELVDAHDDEDLLG